MSFLKQFALDTILAHEACCILCPPLLFKHRHYTFPLGGKPGGLSHVVASILRRVSVASLINTFRRTTWSWSLFWISAGCFTSMLHRLGVVWVIVKMILHSTRSWEWCAIGYNLRSAVGCSNVWVWLRGRRWLQFKGLPMPDGSVLRVWLWNCWDMSSISIVVIFS